MIRYARDQIPWCYGFSFVQCLVVTLAVISFSLSLSRCCQLFSIRFFPVHFICFTQCQTWWETIVLQTCLRLCCLPTHPDFYGSTRGMNEIHWYFTHLRSQITSIRKAKAKSMLQCEIYDKVRRKRDELGWEKTQFSGRWICLYSYTGIYSSWLWFRRQDFDGENFIGRGNFMETPSVLVRLFDFFPSRKACKQESTRKKTIG